eukprot:985717-Pelagomonas_calceolata.AAC.2
MMTLLHHDSLMLTPPHAAAIATHHDSMLTPPLPFLKLCISWTSAAATGATLSAMKVPTPTQAHAHIHRAWGGIRAL